MRQKCRFIASFDVYVPDSDDAGMKILLDIAIVNPDVDEKGKDEEEEQTGGGCEDKSGERDARSAATPPTSSHRRLIWKSAHPKAARAVRPASHA